MTHQQNTSEFNKIKQTKAKIGQPLIHEKAQ